MKWRRRDNPTQQEAGRRSESTNRQTTPKLCVALQQLHQATYTLHYNSTTLLQVLQVVLQVLQHNATNHSTCSTHYSNQSSEAALQRPNRAAKQTNYCHNLECTTRTHKRDPQEHNKASLHLHLGDCGANTTPSHTHQTTQINPIYCGTHMLTAAAVQQTDIVQPASGACTHGTVHNALSCTDPSQRNPFYNSDVQHTSELAQ